MSFDGSNDRIRTVIFCCDVLSGGVAGYFVQRGPRFPQTMDCVEV
jgi:hypothetical protein